MHDTPNPAAAPKNRAALPSEPPTGTPAALIAAGLSLFGRNGFAATSTREIAAAAGTNVASIAYHFGGKEGLHRACAAEVARRLAEVAVLEDVGEGLSPEQAQAKLERLVRAMVAFLVSGKGAGDVVAFVLRELSTGSGAAIDILYSGLIEGKHRDLCRLWAVATGRAAESETTRLAVFSVFGQIVYFRIALPVVSRRMDWSEVGPDEVDAIVGTVIANLRAAIERSREP